ncbi:MAG: flagellar biosynthetic protein FliQ [Sphingopyxis sp.]
MDEAAVLVDLTQQSLRVLLLASTPILVPALLVGLVFGMIQAATSINEATLSFVPKLIVIACCLFAFGAAIGNILRDFTLEIFETIPLVSGA